MWLYIKVAIFLFLLVLLLGTIAYLYITRWASETVDKNLAGEYRTEPDIIIDPGPKSYEMDNYATDDSEDEDEEEFDTGYLSD
jgi:hypothetical protein